MSDALALYSIDLVLRKVIDGYGTVVIGCIDPTSRIRARTTLGVLAKLKDVVLPPLKRVSDAASQPPPNTVSPPAAAVSAGPPNMVFIDEEHRECYMSVSRDERHWMDFSVVDMRCSTFANACSNSQAIRKSKPAA